MTTTKAGAHTQGRLIVAMDEQNNSAYLVGDDKKAVARVINAGLRGDYGNDARRLAACWNMCENISTENIEGGMTLVQRIGVYADDMAAANARCREAEAASTALMAELAAARALLAEVSQKIERMENSWCFDDEIVRIDAFLKGQK